MKIKNGIERELGKIKRKEDRFLREEPKKENEKLESVKGKINEKIPPKLVDTLNKAFTKAFYLVFEKGNSGGGENIPQRGLEFRIFRK